MVGNRFARQGRLRGLVTAPQIETDSPARLARTLRLIRRPARHRRGRCDVRRYGRYRLLDGHERERSRPDTEVQARLDLRPYAIMPGQSQTVERPPLQFARGRVLLTFVLPMGSERGRYEVEVRDPECCTESVNVRRGEASRSRHDARRYCLDLAFAPDRFFDLIRPASCDRGSVVSHSTVGVHAFRHKLLRREFRRPAA